MQFHYSTFWQNLAHGNGGAVSVTTAQVLFRNCSFTENEVRLCRKGGWVGDYGIFAHEALSCNCPFTENEVRAELCGEKGGRG